MHSRVLCCVLLCACAAPGQNADAQAIIRRLAETVAAAKSYDVLVRADNTYQDSDISLPRPVEIRLTRSGNRFRFQGGLSKRQTISMFVSDGTLVWEYLPLWGQYLEETPTSRSGRRILNEVREIQQRHWTRFAMLAKFRLHAVLERTETIRTRDGKLLCSVIRITPEDVHERTWEERLWVESATGLVRKAVMKRQTNDGVRAHVKIETMVWEHISLDAPNDDALFRFNPPKGARLVEVLRPPPGPQQGD